MKVEVELEDLETIVFSTSVIKTIEGALQSRKQDPFVKPHLEYTKAHDYLVAAMNSARRSESGTATQWDGELTKDEILLLKQFEYSPIQEVDGEFRTKHDEIDTLAAKGCLRIGQLVAGAVWPGEQRADIKPVAGYALSLTVRGRDKLEALKQKGLHNNEAKS